MVQSWLEDIPLQDQLPHHTQRHVRACDDTRHTDDQGLYGRRLPMSIDYVLRTYCGIMGESFFVAAFNSDGAISTFISPEQLGQGVYESFFDHQKFQEVMRLIGHNGPNISEISFAPEVGLHDRHMHKNHDHSVERQRLPSGSGGDWDDSFALIRKRRRARNISRKEDKRNTVAIIKQRGLLIGDFEAVDCFYRECLKRLQQGACKLLAKAWVKLIEPKKQTAHPYTRGDEGAPEWWPKPWGPTKEERVRHKEPDHLYKTERMNLIIHILRLAVEPVRYSYSDQQKLAPHINVKKLEDATWKALFGCLAGIDSDTSRRSAINDFFRVAKTEELFKNGSLEDTTRMFVEMKENKTKGQTSGIGHKRKHHGERNPLSPPRLAKPSVALGVDCGPHFDTPTEEMPMRTTSFTGQNGQTLGYMTAYQFHTFGQNASPVYSQAAVDAPIHGELSHYGIAGTIRHGSLLQDRISFPGSSAGFQNHWQPVPAAPEPGPDHADANPQTHPHQ